MGRRTVSSTVLDTTVFHANSLLPGNVEGLVSPSVKSMVEADDLG